MIKGVLLICFLTLILPVILIYRTVGSHNLNERFEEIYASSGTIVVFYLLIVILLTYYILRVYSGYWGNKSIYTFLTLPVNRRVIYLSKLSAFMICFLLFYVTKILSVHIGYHVFILRVDRIAGNEFIMNNGLFLAVLRSNYLQILFPYSFHAILSNIAIVICLVTSVYYAALCERSQKYLGFIFVILSVGLTVFVLIDRINRTIYDNSGWYISSGFLLVLSLFFIWHSIKLYKRGAIV
ncbi:MULTISPECIES: hypothetical protein [Bacillaceae]|uniref:ABC transporter permease n=1 Tax=Evansella alkalicola TaxID=745819 RepID=A0ABS6JN71_9BACI|nr:MULTISPECIES: hypothetical protein [Bacillaceae]MBU9720005.1 hypothetical protein [Bacillus alkalicola]